MRKEAMRGIERGFLLIADLSGYTTYLASSEPEHAPVIAADFIENVVANLRGQFRLVKLEGDAAFMWARADRIDGSSLLDGVDAAYFAFRRRMQSVSQATECDCNACRRMPQLDLKFVVHVGDVLRHRVAGREELAGRDVIVVHRLLKGTAAGRAGAGSYLLLTAATVEALGLDPDALGMTSVTERYEELGAVHGYVLDLGRRWQGEQQQARRARPAGRLMARLERLLPAPPSLAWEFLTAPGKRMTWEGIVQVDEALEGRRGVGTTMACVSGRLKMLEEILDWRPFDAFARRVAHPQLGRVTAIHRLSELARGSHLQVSWFTSARAADTERARHQDRFIAEQSAALDRLVDRLDRETRPAAALPVVEPMDMTAQPPAAPAAPA